MTILKEIPSPEEYISLRNSVGWLTPDNDACTRGLPSSCYCVTIREEKKLIAMGRIIGDGVFTFFIVDIIVHPDYQKKGLGRAIMENIFEYLKGNAAEYAYIALMAAKGKEAFYEKFGFILRPNESLGAGMILDFKDPFKTVS